MLERIAFGSTGLQVTRLAYGTGHMGLSRVNLSPQEGAALMRYACELGVNFIDTAVSYGTHPHVALALRGVERSQVVILSKTDANDATTARGHIEQARRELETDYLDIFLLHGVRSAQDFETRQPALEELCRAQERGLLRAVGASTHIESGSVMPPLVDDPRIQVILTLGNKEGLGLRGRPFDAHLAYIKAAGEKGKAVMLMKVLGEGRAAANAEEWMRYALSVPGAQAFTLGMLSRAQVEMAVKVVAGERVPQDLRAEALKAADTPWARTYPDHFQE